MTAPRKRPKAVGSEAWSVLVHGLPACWARSTKSEVLAFQREAWPSFKPRRPVRVLITQAPIVRAKPRRRRKA